MSDPVIRRVRRSIDEAKNRGGMQAGMPKVTIDAADAERLCIMAEALATAQSENEALRQHLKGMMTAQWKVGVDYGQAFILRKQAEAVEHYREALGMWLKELPGNPCASFVEGIISSAEQANRQAQRLRQQADEAERAVGEK